MGSIPKSHLGLGTEGIRYILNHVFLPPKLPQKNDYKQLHVKALLDTTLDSLVSYKKYVPPERYPFIDNAITQLESFISTHQVGQNCLVIDENQLKAKFEKLCLEGGSIPLHVSEQNAGILITKVEQGFQFELFELSPLNDVVMRARGRLQRQFPGHAVLVKESVCQDASFQNTLIATIAKLSHQAAASAKPKAQKHGIKQEETRDTTDPKLVTGLLSAFLLASSGSPQKVPVIWKNMREEVLYDCAELPWHRSSVWLFLRVLLQITFDRVHSSSINETTHHKVDSYKEFMMFNMARILKERQCHDLRSDELSVMTSKVSRRLRKLNLEVHDSVREYVHQAIGSTNIILSRRWEVIQERESPALPFSTLQHLNFNQDCLTPLPELEKFIDSIELRCKQKIVVDFKPRHELAKYKPRALPAYIFTAGGYEVFHLAAVEDWVEKNLNQWLEAHVNEPRTSQTIYDLIKRYYQSATNVYTGNPEGISLMILTIFELWVACDKSALHICPLLQDYEPGIPLGLLQNLLLPFKSQMERLHNLEKYLVDRTWRSDKHMPPIFASFGSPLCFSVRYFDKSSHHQKLLSRIQQDAEAEREKKIREFDQKLDRYNELMRKYNNSVCEYIEELDSTNGCWYQRHKAGCEKCRCEREASQMKIEIHEWPLPSDLFEAKSTVFELHLPESFCYWREAAIFVLLDVLKMDYAIRSGTDEHHGLPSYDALAQYFQPSLCGQRVYPLSSVKPFMGTHYRTKNMSLISKAEEILLPNAMSYQYFDASRGCFTSPVVTTLQVPRSCTYTMPEQSSVLDSFLFRPASQPDGLPPNQAIAMRSDCPGHLSLHEFDHLCLIPFGFRLSWQNILRELFQPSVDFKKTETLRAISQCIHQAGPLLSQNALREAHSILSDLDYANRLLEGIWEASNRLKKNWQSLEAFDIFISIAKRLLSLTSDTAIAKDCIKFLADARATALGWSRLLREKARQAENGKHRDEFQAHTVKASLVCARSFDVENEHLVAILGSPDDSSIFLECSIVIQEGTNSQSNRRDLLFWQWRRLCYRCYPILSAQITEDGRALDTAIQVCWSTYRPQLGWKAFSTSHDSWMMRISDNSDEETATTVHFDLLTGELLVNGLPLNRPPPDYESHSTYHTLFGKSRIEVMPSDEPGLVFSSKAPISKYGVHFGMQGQDLLVRASKDNTVYELVPSRVLSGYFPKVFVEDCVHWYNTTEKCIELRLKNDPWGLSKDGWTVSRVGATSNWTLENPTMSLAALGSATAMTISKILFPLESPSLIHCLLIKTLNRLDIELPGIQLRFVLHPGETRIRSKEFRGMFIDEKQGAGTLIGLRNKLILCTEKGANERIILVPEGQIICHRVEHHIDVTIQKHATAKVHAYNVDTLLGMLTDNGSLGSKLLLTYLHAVTSFVLPDPLTSRTGTEQALLILKSAALRSFSILDQEDISMLLKISMLTPRRTYYPSHLKVMQSVEWFPNISSLAHHNDFYLQVESIFEQANASKFFYSNWVEPGRLPTIERHLLDRDTIRASSFRVSEFGAESHTCKHDLIYKSRDNGFPSENMTRAFEISTIIHEGHLQPSFPLPKDLETHLVKFLCCAPIPGSNSTVPHMEIKYDSRWLLPWSESVAEFLIERWKSLHRTLSDKSNGLDKYHLAIWLATLAFGEKPNMVIIHMLCSFFNNHQGMSKLVPPTSNQHFGLEAGWELDRKKLSKSARNSAKIFSKCPEAEQSRLRNESDADFHSRRHSLWQSNQNRAIKAMVDHLYDQWPCEAPRDPNPVQKYEWAAYIDINKAMHAINARFKRLHDNLRFREYLVRTIGLVSTTQNPIPMPRHSEYEQKIAGSPVRYLTRNAIFLRPAPSIPKPRPTDFLFLLEHAASEDSNTDYSQPSALLLRLKSRANSAYEKNYTKDLEDSLNSLHETEHAIGKVNVDFKGLESILTAYLIYCHKVVTEAYNAMFNTASARVIAPKKDHDTSGSPGRRAVDIYQLPRFSPIFFLQQLTQPRWKHLQDDWKDCILSYGLAITELQRAERLRKSCERRSQTDLAREIQNTGHSNWDPRKHPEYLLLEIESRIMIRPVQQQIAAKMSDPPSGENAVMQLNMGEGKSTVIVPMVTTRIADGSQLVRVIVAKPQAKQMFQMLVSKLGGLLNRRIFHMPFSRSVKVGPGEAKSIQNVFDQCKHQRGVLLLQPEHILSFQLMGIEHAILGRDVTSRLLLNSYQYLHSSCRDVVDESDENFSTKFELVYTMGTQRPVDHGPERWTCIQDLLSVFRRCIATAKASYPQGVETYSGQEGCFPRTRIIQKDALNYMLDEISKAICDSGLKGFPIAQRDDAIKKAVGMYISDPAPSKEVIDQVEREGSDGFWAESSRNTLLLLRGLIAGGVLAFVFCQKRWRVDYGLDGTRSPNTNLAVPYRAKDQPSARSEFSHPDVIIILTSLSYYYEGLSDQNLKLAISHLIQSSQADSEYEAWVRDSNQLPQSFRQLSGLNLDDPAQCKEEVYPCLRFSKAAIDYFLAYIVFSKEMKEFPYRLSASGWDIGKTKERPTTGFSGTKDSENVLPLSVKQLNLAEQKHTNALVLKHLLQPENSVDLIPPLDSQKDQTNVDLLLNHVVKMDPEVRVILDVGAQILELDNLGVVQKWLHMLPDEENVQAAIFFDAEDNICVVDRNGRIEGFQSSPFASQTDRCIVFLDDAHTRGTDLKLPEHYRAAVTLGANLVKDRLVQACMRMRKLGHGQSIVFCITEEIQRKIESFGSAEISQRSIQVPDVLQWAISETWRESRRNTAVWATQGRRFQRNDKIWSQIKAEGNINLSKEQGERFLEEESQSIEVRYRPKLDLDRDTLVAHDPSDTGDEIYKRCRQVGVLKLDSATLQEEQERELSPEVEEEREVQRPDPAKPLDHHLHPDVKRFVRSGKLPSSSSQFLEAFQSLPDSSAAKYLKPSTTFPRGAKVTLDFQRTVEPDGLSYISDSYQRPVQWILRSRGHGTTHGSTIELIISPFEAQELLPAIKKSKHVSLHIYAPLMNPEYRSLDTLDLYMVPKRLMIPMPRSVMIGLNLFSGQLYVKSLEESEDVRLYLCTTGRNGEPTTEGEQDTLLQASVNGARLRMDPSLVAFMKVLMMKIRRNCESIGKTHVGFILDERRLCEEDFPVHGR